MSIYRYNNGSVIDKITFKKSDNGSIRAYLHADDNADTSKLSEINHSLSAHEWQCIPTTQDGKAVLEVRGFGSEQKLHKALTEHSFVKSEATIAQTTDDKVSFTDKLKNRTLQASGLVYLLGDAAYMKYGQKKSCWEEVLAGLMYFGGTATVLGYGNHDNATQEIHDIAKKMQEAVELHSGNLPESCSLSAITKDNNHGIIKKADDLLTRYPSEIMNSFFGLAGACIATAAIRHGVISNPELLKGLSAKDAKSRISSSYIDIGVGVMNILAGGVAALMTEKAPDPDAPKKHGVEALWEWIQQKPLAVSGIGLMISTCLHAVSSYKEYGVAKANNDKVMLGSVPFRIAFIGCSLVAELLIAMSSKGHGSGVVVDKSVDDSLISIAADLIVKQPEAERNHLIEYMSGFLGRNDVLAMKDEQVKILLQKQVELLQKNPWAECHNSEVKPILVQNLPEQLLVNNEDTKFRKMIAAQMQGQVRYENTASL